MPSCSIIMGTILALATLANVFYGLKEMKTLRDDISSNRFIYGNSHHSWAHFGMIGFFLTGLITLYFGMGFGEHGFERVFMNAIFHFGFLTHLIEEREQTTK